MARQMFMQKGDRVSTDTDFERMIGTISVPKGHNLWFHATTSQVVPPAVLPDCLDHLTPRKALIAVTLTTVNGTEVFNSA
jgi:hypothetical protein